MTDSLLSGDLTAQAKLLELLLSATQDGIVDWDLQTGKTVYNARFRHALGYDGAEQGEPCGGENAWRELMHHEDRLQVLRLLDDHLKQGWPLFTTVRMRHRHGGYRYVMLRGSAQRDEHDQPVRLVLIFSDIDERIRGEERQRALVSALPDKLLRVRDYGRVVSVKRGVEREGSPFAALHTATIRPYSSILVWRHDTGLPPILAASCSLASKPHFHSRLSGPVHD